jgi:nucleoside-diphosphate-sugar epimerase
MPEKKYFNQLIKTALANQPILTNSGKKKRDYIYIDDVIEALYPLLKAEDFQNTHILYSGGKIISSEGCN